MQTFKNVFVADFQNLGHVFDKAKI